jgi:RNA polymerase sigma factor (sigma-70 family)
MHQPVSQPEPDRSTFEMLYRRHMPVLLAYVRRQMFSPEDAEDLLVEVFLAALENRETLETISDQEQLAWLRRVAHNKLVDFYRRGKRRPVTSLEEQQEMQLYEDEERLPEQVTLRAEEYTWIRTHLELLSNQQQEIVRLHFAAGLRCIEIAQLLNKREGAVRMLLARALNKLRSFYAQQQKEERL